MANLDGLAERLRIYRELQVECERMRDTERQEEFLEHGRFGEGEEALTRTKVGRLLWIGLFCLFAAAITFGSVVVFDIGRDDGGPLLVMGSIALAAIGLIFSACGSVRMRSR